MGSSVGTGPRGQFKTPNMVGSIGVQCGRALFCHLKKLQFVCFAAIISEGNVALKTFSLFCPSSLGKPASPKMNGQTPQPSGNANPNFFSGGRISIFQHILPTIGPGALTNREAAANSSGGDAKNKDTSLLGPSTGIVNLIRCKLFLEFMIQIQTMIFQIT